MFSVYHQFLSNALVFEVRSYCQRIYPFSVSVVATHLLLNRKIFKSIFYSYPYLLFYSILRRGTLAWQTWISGNGRFIPGYSVWIPACAGMTVWQMCCHFSAGGWEFRHQLAGFQIESLKFSNFFVSIACCYMVIHHTHCLHKCIANGWAYEFKVFLF